MSIEDLLLKVERMMKNSEDKAHEIFENRLLKSPIYLVASVFIGVILYVFVRY
jgi:hypothetical protein